MTTPTTKIKTDPVVVTPSKTITITRIEGQKWQVKFGGLVRMADVNHLPRLIRREFMKMKRQNRLRVQSEVRREKEMTNE